MRALDNVWLRHLLTPPGLAYRAAVLLRNDLYRRGILTAQGIGIPVVSVGNLTTGGSGKTPFVAYLAARMRDAGRRVAVASRGYGGRRHDSPRVVSDGAGPRIGAEEAGDEPVFLATFLPSVVVVVCRDRVAAARFVRDRYGCDLVVLDDGFQHRRLHRDLDLLLVDALEGLGNGRMLPLGPLREPAEELRRAHALIVTGGVEELAAGAARLGELARSRGLELPIFPCERRREDFLRTESGDRLLAKTLKGTRVLAFSGIARPEAFESDLRSLGVEIVSSVRFRDHQALGPPELERIRSAARKARADLVVTTEKDRARLGPSPFSLPLCVLRIRLVPQSEEELWRFVSGRLFHLPASPASASG